MILTNRKKEICYGYNSREFILRSAWVLAANGAKKPAIPRERAGARRMQTNLGVDQEFDVFDSANTDILTAVTEHSLFTQAI